MDVWSLTSVKEAGDPKGVGYAKSWGCVGYAVASISAGLFVKGRSASSLLPVFSVLLAAMAIVMRTVKIGKSAKGNGKNISFRSLRLGRILQDKSFLIFLFYDASVKRGILTDNPYFWVPPFYVLKQKMLMYL